MLHTIDNNSFSVVEYFTSALVNVRDAKEICRSVLPSSLNCERTAPIAKFDASVVKINCLLKSGYIKTLSDVIISLHFSKHDDISGVISNFIFFFNYELSGFVTSAKPCTNFL